MWFACSSSTDDDEVSNEGDIIISSIGEIAHLTIGGKFVIHGATFKFNRTVAEFGSIYSEFKIAGEVSIGSSIHIAFSVHGMILASGGSSTLGSKKMALYASANLRYESDALTLAATGTYAAGKCPASGIEASLNGQVTLALTTPVSGDGDEAPENVELMLHAALLCTEMNKTHQMLDIVATGKNIKLGGGVFDMQLVQIEASVGLPRTELATLVMSGNVTANLRMGTLPGMALSLEGNVLLDATIDYNTIEGLKLKTIMLDASVMMEWEEKVKINGAVHFSLPCVDGISQTLELEADFNFQPSFSATGVEVRGRYNCGVSGNSSAAMELTGAFTQPIIIGSAQVTGVMLDLAVYHLEDGNDGYVGSLDGKVSFGAGQHDAMAANLGRPELGDHFRAHAKMGAS